MRREEIMSEILDEMHEFSRLRKEAEEIRLQKDVARRAVLHGIDQLRWIPAEEMLPMGWSTYLVTLEDETGHKMVLETCYDPDCGWTVAHGQRVLAWMDLPSAYED